MKDGQMRDKWALVTGASSGIGLELARIHAEQGGNLVLVARRKDRLMELKKNLEANFNIKAEVIVQDLSQKDAPRAIYDAVKKLNLPIDCLINNAGFGLHGALHKQPLDRLHDMIAVNIASLTALTHLFLADMRKRKQGHILNVASVAGFLTMPYMSVYCATKFYVVAFSQAVAAECFDSGVSVTALCPGYTQTEFIKLAKMENRTISKYSFVASADKVARVGYKAMVKGKLIVMDQWFMRLFIHIFLPLIPKRLYLKVGRSLIQ